MRIISPFHDYYDSAMAFGQDLGVVYARKEDPVQYASSNKVPADLAFMLPCRPDVEHRLSFATAYWDSTGGLFPLTVAFCGRLYRGVRVVTTDGEQQVFYDKPSLVNYLEQGKHAKLLACLEPEARRRPSWYKKMGAAEFFSKQGDASNSAYFLENRLPVLAWTPGIPGRASLARNIKLADFQFYRVFDAYTAYQELDMFISGVLAPESRPMSKISDKVKAQQHGFDCHSFRTDPTKKAHAPCK